MNEPLPSPSGAIDVDQHSLGRAALLHLAPGAAIASVFFGTAPVFDELNLPPLMALVLADAVVLPVILGYLLLLGYRRNGRASLDGIVLYRESMPLSRWLWLVPVLLVLAGLMMAAFSPISELLFDAFFAWLPASSVLGHDLAGYDRGTLAISLLVFTLVVVVMASTVEELYFRGYLLPRLSRFGVGAPMINTVLFAMYHLWTPWLAVARVFAFFPLAFAVFRTRSVVLAVVVHLIGNAVDVVGWLTLVL
jgi:membrane protease YdiL (CAAX protease family)